MYQRIILLILFPLFGFSQAPQKINFQSILRNTNGEVVANKNVKLKISIQSGSMMDTTVYSETHLKTTDVSGLMSIKIGTGTVIMGRFDSIKWGKAPHFIKLEADFNGGNNFVLLGTQELMSVPYAFHSNTADSLVGGINLKDIKDIKDELANLRDIVNRLDIQTPLTDIDGNIYNKIIIGNQVWMAENLRVSRYRNGDSIPINANNWYCFDNLTIGLRRWYDDDSITYENPYGNLYNWYAASDLRGICPTGWHVPNKDEFSIMISYLGGINEAGGKLKSIGTTYWRNPNVGATNESGFSALPGGLLYCSDNSFGFVNYYAKFWSSTADIVSQDYERAFGIYLNTEFREVIIDNHLKKSGQSIRCIKD